MTATFGATTNCDLDPEPTTYFDETSSDEDQPDIPVTATTVNAMMRKINIKKAIPEWSIPTSIWLLAATYVNTTLATVWNEIATCRKLPEQWEEMQTVWLDKIGKDSTKLANKRAINLSDPALKGYLNYLQAETREYMLDRWQPTTYGGVPFKSGAIAILIVQELMSRAKKAGRNYFMYMGDAIKAFDTIKRMKIWKATRARLAGLRHIATRLKTRHRRTIYATKVDNRFLKLKMTEGVAQGDPNGQSLFVLTYEEFGKQIDSVRGGIIKMDFTVPKNLIEELEECTVETISLHKHMFVDDHAEIHVIQQVDEISKLIVPILEMQGPWGLATNMDKSFALVKVQGKGSKKKLKNLDGKLKVGPFGNIKIVYANKYLGVVLNADGDMNEEVTCRILQAHNAMQRLSKIWQTHEMTRDMKVQVFTVMVKPILTYALEAHVLTFTQLQRLEAAHTRMLRRVARAPAHIDKESNMNLRSRLNIHSLSTTLIHRRLTTFRNALLHPMHNLAYFTAMFGTSEIDHMKIPTIYTSKRVKQLVVDLNVLHNLLPAGAKIKSDWNPTTEAIGKTTFDWLKKLTKIQLTLVLNSHSNVERSSTVKATVENAPTHVCLQCTASFDTYGKLQTHRYQAHNIRHPLRRLATTPTCPLCSRTYKNLRTCQEHIATVCGLRATDQTIRILTQALEDAEAKLARPGGPRASGKAQATGPSTQNIANIQVMLSRVEQR